MAINPNWPLDQIIAKEYPSNPKNPGKDYSITDGGPYFQHGNSKNMDAALGVKKLHDDVYYGIFGKFIEYAAGNGLRLPYDAYLPKLFFGVFTEDNKDLASNDYLPIDEKTEYSSRKFNIIFMKDTVYRDLIVKNTGLAQLLMLHEMLHCYYHLNEIKTYGMISKFYHYLYDGALNGTERREYRNLAKIADLLLKSYHEHPYEERLHALRYIDRELSRNDISGNYRSHLETLKEYLTKNPSAKAEKKESKSEKPEEAKAPESKKTKKNALTGKKDSKETKKDKSDPLDKEEGEETKERDDGSSSPEENDSSKNASSDSKDHGSDAS